MDHLPAVLVALREALNGNRDKSLSYLQFIGDEVRKSGNSAQADIIQDFLSSVTGIKDTQVFTYQSNLYSIDEDTISEEHPEGVLHYLHSRYSKRALQVDLGGKRTVYVMDSYVVKIPRNGMGIGDNDWEGSITKTDPEGPKYARTRLHYYKEIPILFMERLKPILGLEEVQERLGNLPDWIYGIDCCQVGWSKNGELKAYDYGIH